MRFVKMQGTGNDFIVVDCFDQSAPQDPGALARRLCPRRHAVGADGLILVLPSDVAVARMRIFNADGSEAEMCGNGLRCVVRYLYERLGTNPSAIPVETAAGVLKGEVLSQAPEGGLNVRIDMGRPVLEPQEIPTSLIGRPPLNVRKVVRDRVLQLCVLSMGNPHCVVFLKEPVEKFPVQEYGLALECSHEFPERTNVEFVNVLSPSRVRVRVWERGCGETQACGTGACAVVVAGALTNRTARQVAVELPGGTLDITWASDDHVYLSGPALCVYHGELCTDLVKGGAPAATKAVQTTGP